ncbi:unnamed protein product [Nezara viridula]|uniref:BOD1/SHG1 domain-containing protein n=1 Tax=Nezara viridula TaxID=85310 RepID=A0A9P0H884_NEZVI|nr:unnamed protein product [Nezara viridula]
MSFETFPQYPPVDGELVDRIVCKLKSQGIFDQFRKDCLADVDTKPAYQNLQQRVNGTVATFLATQTWQQDLNKTQLRESLRRHVQQGFLEVGVDRIVDQVVNPKVFTVFMPKVEDVVYDCLGIEKPKHPPSSNNLLSGHKLTLLDLLPKDLDPVSPESDNLSFDDDETKDETNNNESSSKLDISHDSQVSGISDLSSHMGDSFKENHIDSNTAKSIASVKENSNEPHFENFENLSEKIKQAEIGGHNSATSPSPEGQNNTETLEVEQNLQKDNRDDTLMEIDSVSNSTFEDTKMFTNKIIKEHTCSSTISEDSLSCSSFNSKFKKDKSKSVVVGTSENSVDKSEVDTPCKELSSDKEVKISAENNDVDIKTEEKVTENKEPKKPDDLKDKKYRESLSSKNTKSSRPSDSKHRSSSDKKDDIKQSKEKTYKEDKDKEKSNRDDKDRSSKHKDDRHHSSKDKYKDKDKNDRSREKDNDKKKDKSDNKDLSAKDKKNDKDRYKDKDKNDKEKTRNDKENHKYEKDKSRSEKDKDRHEKEKDKYDKDRSDKSKRDKDKDKREKEKYESKDRDSNEKDKDKTRGKSEKDYKNEKDKESRSVDEKVREDKKKDSKKYDKSSSSSSMKKDDNKSEARDKSRRTDDNAKEKTSNSKSNKNDDERKDRKRKSERCNDEIKLKEARRSWDRDSSGGNGKGHGSQKSNNSEYKVSSSSSSTKEKRTGESSNQQKANERKLEPVSEAEEPSDVDKILMKINSSIEESQNIQSNDEQAIKKPKIARNIFEIRKIMQARKNIARQAFKQDKKRKEMMDSVEEVDVTNSPSTTDPPSRDSPKIREENKENIKAGQMDKLKTPKVGPIKGKFNGFLESDIEQSRNSLQIFRAHFSNFCTSMGMEILPTENIAKVDFSKICDFSDDLLDDNLNKLKPKSVSLERRKTFPDDNQVSKAVENIMKGKNGCYVLLKDCTEVVEAMKNAAQPQLNKSDNIPTASKPQQNIGVNDESNRTNLETNVKTPDCKKETLSSAVIRPQVFNVGVDVGTDTLSHTSQQQSKQENSKKTGVRTPPAKEQPTQNSKDEEAFSPVADVTIALNTYLNDSKEILPSVPLTEAMLDNLMQQSSMIVEDETFADSDDSLHEFESLKNVELGLRKEESFRTSGDVSDSSDYTPQRIASIINTSTCDIFSQNKDPNEETSEIKVVKRRNQRVCRSASQRYDSTDLYKPRPVLPQNSKRVRTPRSVSSEDISTREQYECTPSRKRAR